MIGITPGFEATAKMLVLSLAESGPVEVDEFDDAWVPAGENYRDELVSGGLVTVGPTEDDGPPVVALTGAGVALAAVEQAKAQQA